MFFGVIFNFGDLINISVLNHHLLFRLHRNLVDLINRSLKIVIKWLKTVENKEKNIDDVSDAQSLKEVLEKGRKLKARKHESFNVLSCTSSVITCCRV